MTPEQFISQICNRHAGKAICVSCRCTQPRPHTLEGPKWRKDNNAPEVCPRGLPWDYSPETHPELAKKFNVKRSRDGAAPNGTSSTLNSQPSTKTGPGDLLKKLIDACGFKQTANCGCAAMQRRMNDLGWLGCWTHRAEILAWLQKKAKEQGIELEEATVYAAIKAAFRERRKKGKIMKDELGSMKVVAARASD